MFQRTSRVCACVILLCLVASCATKKVTRRELCDTSVFNNTVWRSFQYKFDDTIDVIVLDEDSTRPAKRVIRHSQLSINDTTRKSAAQMRKQEEQKQEEYQHNNEICTIGISYIFGSLIVLLITILFVVRHVRK